MTKVERRILFLHDDKELPQFLEKEFNGIASWAVAFEPFGRFPKLAENHHYDLVILESKKGWISAFQQLHSPGAAHYFPVLAIPAGLWKKDCRRVVEAVKALLEDSERPMRSPSRQNGRAHSRDPLLQDFVERTFKEFVKKVKASQARNLYDLLLREIERPLISLTLKETNGNQIKAAMILGMNRNTLRKKIKELKIPLKPKTMA